LRRRQEAGETATAESFTRSELEEKSLADLHELAAAREIARYRLLRREALIDEILAAAPVRAAAKRWEEPEASEMPPRREPAPVVAEEEDEAQAEAEAEAAQAVQVESQAEEEEEEDQREREESSAEAEEEKDIRSGVLEVVPDGYGFVRVRGFSRSNEDVYVSAALVRELGLRRGDEVRGSVRPPRRSERYLAMVGVETVNGRPVEAHDLGRPAFEDLTPVGANQLLSLRHEPEDLALRMIQLVALIGKGQRWLIAGPPASGATTLLRAIAGAVGEDGLTPLVIALDAPPEEVTDWRRSADLEVNASSAEQSAQDHVELAELSLERAKRLVEDGKDVVILLDSLTRLARAYELARSGSRRSGEVGDDTGGGALAARRWFASGRNTEERGSLTVVATVRAGSGSRLEELVHNGVADLAAVEVRLHEELAGALLWPAIDIGASRARTPEPALEEMQALRVQALHRRLGLLEPAQAWRLLAARISESPTNAELVSRIDAED
jgi:transcription termination factor Rho